VIGRHVTLVVWGVLGLLVVACQVTAAISGRRLPGLGSLVVTAMSNLPGRYILLLAWMWLGWHAFAR
jgi:hypothetical protein